MCILQRIKEYIDYKGITNAAFERSIGMSNASFSKSLRNGGAIGTDKLENILSVYPDLSPEWLLTGRGDMLYEEPKMVVSPNKSNGIPLVPIEAMAGVFQGEQGVHLSDCEYYVVPLFSDADYLIPIKGDSMQPYYYSGDIVACKKTSPQSSFFQWGKVYVVDTEQGVLIKRLFQGETKQTITLVSDNEKYPPIEIPREEVYHIAVVLGTLRSE